MPLKDIIQKNAVSIMATGSVMDAAKLMKKNQVGSVVILDKKKSSKYYPVGILTDRDIVMALARNKNFDVNSSIKSIMTSNVVLCNPEDGIYDTIKKMQTNGIRRLPVVDKKDTFIGVVSSDDLLQLLGEEIINLSRVITNEIIKEKNIKTPVVEGKHMMGSTKAS